ncbi:hypothetical protein [Aestuariibaculum sediminum]|uniref:Uncharacterized protein n=1 Tax=Aestuariibaculum sediminum TaxID=2770637 RepID=A0A8J6Q2T7_9FLAO|nr:hypothetical protein [Aestuariibaculum sediminum]MBD0832624.1 hypothetical protein [Aestuariibaculum sediminum]
MGQIHVFSKLAAPTYEITMKTEFTKMPDSVFFMTMSFLIALSIIATLTSNAWLVNHNVLLFIPLFSLVYFIKYKRMNISVIAFILFSFIGDASHLFFNANMEVTASSVFYLIGIFYLIFQSVKKFKLKVIKGIILGYLLVVFLISTFFVLQVYQALKLVLESSIEPKLFALISISLAVLTIISFGVYLKTQSRTSTMFFIAAISLSFSVGLNYINLYYINHDVFVILEQSFYALSLYFIFKYAAVSWSYSQESRLDYDFGSENIFV